MPKLAPPATPKPFASTVTWERNRNRTSNQTLWGKGKAVTLQRRCEGAFKVVPLAMTKSSAPTVTGCRCPIRKVSCEPTFRKPAAIWRFANAAIVGANKIAVSATLSVRHPTPLTFARRIRNDLPMVAADVGFVTVALPAPIATAYRCPIPTVSSARTVNWQKSEKAMSASKCSTCIANFVPIATPLVTAANATCWATDCHEPLKVVRPCQTIG